MLVADLFARAISLPLEAMNMFRIRLFWGVPLFSRSQGST
jgi:hypothetical protein